MRRMSASSSTTRMRAASIVGSGVRGNYRNGASSAGLNYAANTKRNQAILDRQTPVTGAAHTAVPLQHGLGGFAGPSPICLTEPSHPERKADHDHPDHPLAPGAHTSAEGAFAHDRAGFARQRRQ